MSGLSSIELAERARQKARARLERLRMRKRLWPHDLGAYAEDCLTIRPKTGTPRKFVLNSVQRKLDAALDNQLAETGRVRAIILKARQMGVSTYVGARFYHRMRFHAGHRTLIMTHRDDATTNLAGMVRRYHDHEPEPPVLSVDNATEMVLQNESGIAVATAGAQVTGAGRSFTFQLGHLSEIPSWHAATTHLNAILPAFPTTTGEIIFEATAKGAAGPFYEMAMAAQRGESPFRLLFYPWFEHDEYQTEPARGWAPPEAIAKMGREHGLSRAQMCWAAEMNASLAAIDGDPPDALTWRFCQEYPCTADEAFRAGRPGGYIAASVVAAARRRSNAFQEDMPLVFGCDFATGGGGGDAEHPDSRADRADGVYGTEDGDANVFIDRRGRSLGKHLYDRFRDRNTLSVANRLQAHIVRLSPDRVFMDRGGGGAAVYDVLCARGYGRILELVDFGMRAKPSDKRQYANKRAEMYGDLREWLADDGDIPDDPILETELTATWVHSEDERGLTLAPKRSIRAKLHLSPDGADAACLTFAAPVRQRARGIVVGGSGR